MSGIQCSNCGSDDSIVRDTKPEDGARVRLRECKECGYKFWTHETLGRFPSGKIPYMRPEVIYAIKMLDRLYEVLPDESKPAIIHPDSTSH